MDNHELEKCERIITQLNGNSAPPFKIDLELHRRCNLNCLSCSRRSAQNYGSINEYSEKVEMSTERWLDIVDEAGKIGVKEWHIAGGGEPMFLPDRAIPIMDMIKKYAMYGIITTNGTLWDEEKIEKLVKIGWDRIHFSIDAPDAETHDYLRGMDGAFDKAVNTIKVFNKFKKKYNSEKPMMNTNTVLSVENYKKMPEMVEFVHSIGIEYMFIEPLIVYSDLGRELKLNKSHIAEFSVYLERAKKLADKYGLSNNFSGIDQNLTKDLIDKSSRMDEVVEEDTKEALNLDTDNDFLKKILSIPCYKPWWHMTIKCDGRVTSCDVPIKGGDNLTDKSLKDVWEGEYFQNLRNGLLKSNIPEFCGQCNPSHTTQRRRMRKDIMDILS